MSASFRLPEVVDAVVRRFLESDAPRGAVFDADGTLWRGDVGEDLLRFLSREGVVPGDSYAAYERINAVDAPRSYAFAVEVMAGLAEHELIARCETFFTERFRGRVFPFVRPMVQRLEASAIEVWICSASPRWIVEAGARALGVPVERVIGVDAHVHDGALTSQVIEPVNAGPGKVEWLRRKGAPLGLAVGNGALDFDMLAAAQHQLVIAPFDGGETELVRLSRPRGWPVFRT